MTADDDLPITAGAAQRITALLRTFRWFVVGVIVADLFLLGGIVSGFHRIDRETKARQATTCVVNRNARHEIVAGLSEFGRKRHADPATIAAFQDVYVDLPPPAGCPSKGRTP